MGFLENGLVASLCNPRDSQAFSRLQPNSLHSLAFSYLYSATLTSIHEYWKTIGLTVWTFLGHVISVLFNTLSWLVITFLPRSKRLLVSWLKSPSAVILEPPKIKSDTVEFMLLNCGVGEDSWESLGLQGDPTSPFWRRSALGFLWKEWC